MQVRKQQLELDLEKWTGSKLGKKYVKVYIVTLLLNLYAEYIIRNAELDEAQAGSKIQGKISRNLRYVDDTTLMAECEEDLESLLIKVKEESEKAGLNSTFIKLRSWHSAPSLHGK